jgi:hypothetical protein
VLLFAAGIGAAACGRPYEQAARDITGGAGRVENTPENMVQCHPHSIDNRTLMPEIGVSMQDSRDIAACLYTLR